MQYDAVRWHMMAYDATIKYYKVTSKVASRTAMMSALYCGTLFMEGIAELYLMWINLIPDNIPDVDKSVEQ